MNSIGASELQVQRSEPPSYAALLQRRRTFLFLLRRTFFSTVLKQKFYNITRLLMYSHQLRIFSYGTHKESLIFLTGNRLLSNSLFFLVMFEWYETHIGNSEHVGVSSIYSTCTDVLVFDAPFLSH